MNIDQKFLTAICAGIVSSLPLLASYFISRGDSVIELFILCLTIVPIYALGFSSNSKTASIAVLTSVILLFLLISPQHSFEIAIMWEIPAIGFIHLMLLSRQGAGSTQIMWYPVERILCWIAVTGILIVSIGFFAYIDMDIIEQHLRAMISEIKADKNISKEMLASIIQSDTDQFVKTIMYYMVPFSVIGWMLIHMLGMYLGGRISCNLRQQRPFPDLHAIAVPEGITIAMGIGILMLYLGNSMAITVVAGLMFIHIIAGLSIIHYCTRNIPARFLILAIVYAVVLTAAWIHIILVILAIVDSIYDLRKCLWRGKGTTPP